jgi:hypothetical protein
MAISAATVRYIKLGKGGRWADEALARGELHFGYGKATHELALAGDAEKMKRHLVDLGRSPQAAARDTTEVAEFYELGSDCLWITFAQDHLWWTFAHPEVTWVKDAQTKFAERTRKSIGGWRKTDVNGTPLRTDALSTKLTKVGAYRRTICNVSAKDYLLRRINGLEEPMAAKSAAARTSVLDVLVEALGILHWKDFETLIDIIFARSGWHRVSALGGSQKTTDLEIEQATTGEQAAVQLKSIASQKTFDDYIERVDMTKRFDRFFFVCHSPKGQLLIPEDRPDIHVWTGRNLAETVLKVGLLDWVLEKVT